MCVARVRYLWLILKLVAEQLIGGLQKADVSLGKELVPLAFQVVLHKLGESEESEVDKRQKVSWVPPLELPDLDRTGILGAN